MSWLQSRYGHIQCFLLIQLNPKHQGFKANATTCELNTSSHQKHEPRRHCGLVYLKVRVRSKTQKTVKVGERRRKTANNFVIMKHLGKLVNKIYTSAERDKSGERKLQLWNVFWRLSSYFAVCCLSLAVFRGLQLACVSPFYHVRKIRIIVRLDTKTPF